MRIDGLCAETVLEVAVRLAAAYIGGPGAVDVRSGGPETPPGMGRFAARSGGPEALPGMGRFAELARELVEASATEGDKLRPTPLDSRCRVEPKESERPDGDGDGEEAVGQSETHDDAGETR